MSIVDRLKTVDRRIIFAAISLAVIIPLLFPIGFPIMVSPPAQGLYDAIEELKPGSKVLLSFDYDPSTMPEVYPMNLGVVRHCFSKNIKLVGMGLWPTGVLLGQEAFELLAEEYGKTYGEDYVNLGFKAGGIVVISAMAENIPETFPEDYAGTSIEEFPIMEGVKNFDSFGLAVCFSAGDPGVREWVMIAHSRCGKKVGACITAVMAPAYYPYLQAGQLVGLLGGMKGAAEYETLLKFKGTGSAGMDAQSIAHSLIIVFIIFGNVIYFIARRKERKKV